MKIERESQHIAQLRERLTQEHQRISCKMNEGEGMLGGMTRSVEVKEESSRIAGIRKKIFTQWTE